MENFLEEILLNKDYILFDGAMGTYLYSRGVPIGSSTMEINLSNPSLIRKIHEEYINAGVDIIKTNTWSANYSKLSQYNLENKVYEINFRAAEIAKEASKGRVLIAASIGPLSKTVEPLGGMKRNIAYQIFREQLIPLLDAGVDLILLETFQNLDELLLALKVAKEMSNIPVIPQMTFPNGFSTIYGYSVMDFAKTLENEEVFAIGVNCGLGPWHLLKSIEILRSYTSHHISAQPNAGVPKFLGDTLYYPTDPLHFSEYGIHYYRLGVRILGGCCGTTPKHIAELYSKLSMKRPKEMVIPKLKPEVEIKKWTPTLLQSSLKKFFTILVEVDPPRRLSLSKIFRALMKLRAAGVDAINIGDNPLAKPRINSIVFAHLVMENLGLETVAHFRCRDKNLLAIISDLKSAHILGVRNIVVLTGDPISIGEYPHVTPVMDIGATGVIKLMSMMNRGQMPDGSLLGESTSFYIGSVVNPNAKNLMKEIRLLKKKVKFGARYVLTQPIFQTEKLKRFIKKADLNIHYITGIILLKNEKHAIFLNDEVPGIEIPDEIITKLEEGYSGMEIAKEVLSKLLGIAQGAYIIPPARNISLAGELVEYVKSITKRL